MRHVTIDDLIEEIPATQIVGDTAIVTLDYRGGAQVLAGTPPAPKAIRSRRNLFDVPLIELSAEVSLIDTALQLIMAVVLGRPKKAVMARFADIDIRDALRHADGRGSWTVAARLLADPSVPLPRWVSTHPANLPEGWVIGITVADARRPIVCVRHEGKVGFLARENMIAGVWVH
jgi:hypothetical protein